LANEKLTILPEVEIKIKNLEFDVKDNKKLKLPLIAEKDNKKYYVMDEEQFLSLAEVIGEIVEENFYLTLEMKLLEYFPVDFDDVRAVVIQEVEENDLSIDEAIEKVKRENPHLFRTDLNLNLNLDLP
jgi:hypothetical protein